MQVLVGVLGDRCAAQLDCTWMLWPSTTRERAEFTRRILRTDVAVRVGMPFEFDSETNRLWLHLLRVWPRLKSVNYWIGTDVTDFKRRVEGGAVTPRDTAAIALMSHFAGSPELAAELQQSGVPAQCVVLPSPERAVPSETPPLADRFRVMAYVPDARFDFYGGRELLAAARVLPDAEFVVMGGSGEIDETTPSNVRFLGRVGDVDDFYRRGVVLVRTVEHDSVPSGVIEEALLYGRHVVYSHRWPHTEYVPFGDVDALVSALRRLQRAHAAGELAVNEAGRVFTMSDWNPDQRAERLKDALLDAAERTEGRSQAVSDSS